MRIISWNMAHRPEHWRDLLAIRPDVALVQEAAEPPEEIKSLIACEEAAWETLGTKRRPWKTAVVSLGPDIEPLKWVPLSDARKGEFGVSRPGTLAAATIQLADGPVTLISMYALWEDVHEGTQSSWIYSDASVHRLISDISVLIGRERGHRILAAGDLNILYGYGEHGSKYWKARFGTIFDRMDAIGLNFVGPQFPNGRQAHPWPDELPKDSLNVPTYYHSRQSPDSATRQIDFVFASSSIADRVQTRALNEPDHWGPSDHCMVEIDIAE